MHRLVAIALAFAAATPALAAPKPKLESQVIAATGRALLRMIFDDTAAARAECKTGKALLNAKTPPYLAAYSEECFAVAAAPAGVGNDKRRCPYYLRAIAVWRVSPPPFDDDEDLALRRAGKLREWKFFASQHCDATADPQRADMGPFDSIPEGARLRTQEGLSYLIPDGWTVRKFDETSGFAMLTHADDHYDMRVARVRLNNKMTYTDQTPLPSGGTLEWKYIEFIPKSGMYVMYGRAKLDGAYAEFGVAPSADAPEGASVDKDDALKALIAVADGAKIEGKRACIGNCGPGEIIAPTSASAPP